MPTPPPSLSTRLGDVRSSPVRDILELTQRAEVISFAGGLPAPAELDSHIDGLLRLSFTTHVPGEIAEGLARLGRASGA